MLHCRMLDSTAQLQQEALGILGVNLVHGALSKAGQHYQVLAGLMDDLSRSRIEVLSLATIHNANRNDKFDHLVCSHTAAIQRCTAYRLCSIELH